METRLNPWVRWWRVFIHMIYKFHLFINTRQFLLELKYKNEAIVKEFLQVFRKSLLAEKPPFYGNLVLRFHI